MKQSLGPGTVLLQLVKTTDTRYQKNWRSAFVQVFKLFPYVDDLAKVLAGSKDQHLTLVRLLCDIALFGTARPANKAKFPYGMVMWVQMQNSVCNTWAQAITDTKKLPEEGIHPALKNFDLSGHGMYHMYMLAATNPLGYHINRSSRMTDDYAKETVFHSIFGTQKEDFGLLYYMTGHNFHTRRELGDAFQQRAANPTTNTFPLITFRRICKLASSATTSFVKGGKGQVIRQLTFAGRCSMRVDTDSDYLFRLFIR